MIPSTYYQYLSRRWQDWYFARDVKSLNFENVGGPFQSFHTQHVLNTNIFLVTIIILKFLLPTKENIMEYTNITR